MKSKKKMYIFLSFTVLTIGIMSIAYAYLSSSLNINVTTNQVGKTWNIGFDTSVKSKVIDSGSSTVGRSCGTSDATVNGTSVTIPNVTLSKPGDKCGWKVRIKNSGSIGAYLKTISFSNPSVTSPSSGASIVCSFSDQTKAAAECYAKYPSTCTDECQAHKIKYYISTNEDGTTLVNTGKSGNGILKSNNDYIDLYVIAEYIGTQLISNPSTGITQSSAKFTFTFEQI